MTTTETLVSEIDQCLTGYIECMVWIGLDWPEDQTEEPCPLDENYSVEDVTVEARGVMRDDLAGFILGQLEDCLSYVASYQPVGGYDPWECLGHDFALSRNGHGAGFFDRGLGALGDRLQDAARVYGEQDLYPNPQGELEVEG